MEGIKRCVQCSSENPAGRIYCLKCGGFLKKSDNVVSSPTIWTTTMAPIIPTIPPTKPTSQNNHKVVICPQCKQVEKATDNVLPMTCSNCGYFFQIGVDKIIDFGDISNTKEISNSQPNKKVRKDDLTNLRLIVRTEPSVLPQKINPQGDIIGKNGTVLNQLKIDSQIKVYRAPTGWYIEVLEGECVVQNEHMNKNVERKLKHNDCIYVGKNLLFVEITE